MPTIDGILMRWAHHLTFREAQPGDTNYLGEQIPQDSKVIVSKEDCAENDDGTLDPYAADPIPQIHPDGGFRRAYGEWRKQRDRKGQWVEGEFLKEYYTCPVYLIRDGDVLLGTIYSKTDPRVRDLKQVTEEKREGQDQEEDQQPA
ncbi:hypothetical protein [Salinibacter ruber]|uniref:Uncharacterized protein n=1 Tax=Salinibacter ruber TaxID=146919 RepID=A0A9X2TKF4_9BACT|nr:hypothetical protein [Salinibacter ruber]MCS3661740.1 hypothetical protein [Salinibacter ruber]MCS3711599.1 hypothetical protein [Salinibacter ruber]